MDKIATTAALQKDHDPATTPMAKVRPYPGHVTECLDDKKRLADLFRQSAPEYRDIAPTLVTCHPNDDTITTLVSLSLPSPTGRYFVKHRWGVQGKSVYCFTRAQLVAWWANTNAKRREDFVIQHEVAPALWGHRKFFLRAHILVTTTTVDEGRNHHLEHKAYVHRHIICQHHAVDYDSDENEDKLSHTSHSGSRLKRHPLPTLTGELAPQHPASDCWQEVERVSEMLVCLFRGQLEHHPSSSWMGAESSSGVCFALWGVDLLMRDDGKVLVCEVNTHPALGWGTMANVPSQVYSDIVRDTLDILLYSGGDAPTRFCELL
eukprot:scaffold1893_cov220-Amphora_coffeaeformis.AAC.10